MAAIAVVGFEPLVSYGKRPTVMGKGVRVGLSEKVPVHPPAEDRWRPTGERGSGPYFHAYKRHEAGIQNLFTSGSSYYISSKMDYDEDWWEGEGTYAECHHREIWVANGKTCYVITCRQYSEDYGQSYGIQVSGYMWAVRTWSSSRCYGTSFTASMADTPKDGGCIANMDQYIAIVLERLQFAYDTWIRGSGYTNRWYSYMADEISLPELSFQYLYSERDTFAWHDLTGCFNNHYGALATTAYINACDALPEADTNSIATVLEIAESLTGMLKGDFKSPKGIKDLWLAYRYQVCTTKADVDAYAELTRRLTGLANADSITSYGYATDGNVSCCTSIQVRRDLILPDDAKSWLKTYGFKLSAVNVWDMVPYSFVVDWFLHIGDILSYFESYNNAVNIPVENVWNSFRTRYDNQDTYFRVAGRSNFKLPWVTYKPASGKTIGKRILDSIALFT